MIKIESTIQEQGYVAEYKCSQTEGSSKIIVDYKIEDRNLVVQALRSMIAWIEEK